MDSSTVGLRDDVVDRTQDAAGHVNQNMATRMRDSEMTMMDQAKGFKNTEGSWRKSAKAFSNERTDEWASDVQKKVESEAWDHVQERASI